ncbi:MAG: hypothetical protein JWL71_3781 [Acidobacteria bacterium]|nr:hypothetical protein [Acidobacteriota bacterium]
MAVTVAIGASMFGLVRTAARVSAAEPDTADMQQRLRVAAASLVRDLAMAGAGSYLDGQTLPLVYAVPPVLPFRQGASSDDSAGTFRPDLITLLSVAATSAQTTLSADVAPGVQTLPVTPQSACPTGVNLCGFAAGMTLLVYDSSGNYDNFTVAAVSDAAREIAIAPRPQDSSTTTYKAGSRLVEGQLHTYYVKTDPATQIAQLLLYDGSANGPVPVVDHVVALRFDYYGEPRPPALTSSGTTYGPSPPPPGVRTTAYPAGESCLFTSAADTGVQVPRLATLGPDDRLVLLTATQLTDGPWCPDETNANRWDADLLRIRTVAVTVRVEAALAALRGPAGVLFTNAGTSTGSPMWAPDLEVSFQVAPRNLAVRR